MIYDCLFYDDAFVIAKPTGWKWSPTELAAPFTCYQSPEMQPADDDYTVIVNGQEIAASNVDDMLIGGN